MFSLSEYAGRGYNLVHNRLRPEAKRLSSLMLYATDLCDSGCKHCLIWAKRPVTVLSFEAIVRVMQSKCIHASTVVGLEGGEFLLHPEADRILEWFSRNHANYDLFSNCLKPDGLIESVRRYKPRRLYISLDGDQNTYLHMRGKDGYAHVIRVIRELKEELPVFVMFTLSPYNDYADLKHVAEVCRENGVYLRVGIYNNIPFFDTIDDAGRSFFGEYKNEEVLSFREAKELQEKGRVEAAGIGLTGLAGDERAGAEQKIPAEIKTFGENYDYVKLYSNWRSGKLRLKCNSILDSLIVLPDGKVPICQHLSTPLGNIHEGSLDEIFNSPASSAVQRHHSENCNQCWVSYHRKYDIVLYRSLEKYFGRWATVKLLGYYKWDEDDSLSYREVMAKD
jgi:MoaA/NifB/PqqE/SkfB family radical SAM enzyme